MAWKSTLPMYTIGEAAPASAALWHAVAARLAARGMTGLPARLDPGLDLPALWRDPDLLLGQTCGYPLRKALRGAVQLVATPVYTAEGCVGAAYRSAVIVAAGAQAATLAALRGAVAAVNGAGSNSGMNLFRAAVAEVAGGQPFFRRIHHSTSHLRSVEAVASGNADVAAIDCVTLALIARAMPSLRARVRILCWTAATPGLPLITARRTDPETLRHLRDALQAVAADSALASVRAALLLDGFETVDDAAYDAIDRLEAQAEALGYPLLA